MLIPESPTMDDPTFGETVEDICAEHNIGREHRNYLADVIVATHGVEVVYVHDSPGSDQERTFRNNVLPKAVVEFAHTHDLDVRKVEPLIGHLALRSVLLNGKQLVSMLQSTSRLQLGVQIDGKSKLFDLSEDDLIG